MQPQNKLRQLSHKKLIIYEKRFSRDFPQAFALLELFFTLLELFYVAGISHRLILIDFPNSMEFSFL